METGRAPPGAQDRPLTCPKFNQLEIFFKSHPTEPFEIKICLLMGDVHFIVQRELSRRLALTANPGKLPRGHPQRCPWAEGPVPSRWAHRLPGSQQGTKRANRDGKVPAKKINKTLLLLRDRPRDHGSPRHRPRPGSQPSTVSQA